MTAKRGSAVRSAGPLAGAILICTVGAIAHGQFSEPQGNEMQVWVQDPALSFDQTSANSDKSPESESSDRLAKLEAELWKLTAAEEKRSADAAKRPTFRIGGQLQNDYIYVGQDATSRAAVGDINDLVGFRRARLTSCGDAFEVVEYALGLDFAFPGRPSFLDVFVGVRELPYVGHFRVGHFFEPFSLERLTSNRYNTFMERSLADTFAPARNTGVNIFDTLGEDDRATWSLGWFASDSDNFGDQFTDKGGQAVTGRTTWLPFYDDTSNGRAYLHLGTGYSYRTPASGTLSFAAFPEARAGAPTSASVPTFASTGPIAADSNQLFNAELAWTQGPFSFQSETIYAPVAQSAGQDLQFHGAYAYASCFLTGEHRPYNKKQGTHDRVTPFENFFRVRSCDGPIINGLGAWEVAARLSYLDLSHANIQGGVENNGTLGLNWYLNPYTRVKCEYILAQLDRPPVGQSDTHIYGMRFDIDF